MYIRKFLNLIFVCICTFANVAALAKDYAASCDNRGFLQAQQNFENKSDYSKADVPVHICGTVLAISASRFTRSGKHGYFYLNIGSGVSIRIVSNLDEMHAPLWPWVKKGDYVEVAGRYYYDNPRRQGVDWTHKGTSRKWPYPGYVKVHGIKYD
ncbi:MULTISPECIES: DUF3465 domain-containing protein [Commensalibacter]|uniref:DUF3465 domain-containing protein n=2 Tax=Commensalibacter TaxID=1079922 RepID=W7E1X4_9PROT|nr:MULTISPECIES: DUF3465 domain-containing protein [Commensalibacter]EUK19089.1 hypothetical protein COMX_05045 [Commensalibacter papalotli (ex Servin-Garciduenas et al. 2014)]CAI3922810.1 unnamed protein product [Commensalibacter papalotli (ex Botero et al. 2024)]CAI3929270.1 unnamed protein product [Commensalibacter papalotli (ex Botero et al. 2024)]